jgi:hypothetical protein
MRHLRPSIRLAQKMGEGLGFSEILLGRLPHRQTRRSPTEIRSATT